MTTAPRYTSDAVLPDWVPSGLLRQVLRYLSDNHVIDLVQAVYGVPWVLPGACWAIRSDRIPFRSDTTLDLLVDGVPVAVPSGTPIDMVDRPEPFYLYDGEVLLVFGLHTSTVTAPLVSSTQVDIMVPTRELPGGLLGLPDHFVWGRALYQDGDAWYPALLYPDGLFLPGRSGTVTAVYEKRPPFPVVKIQDGRVLDRRNLWTPCDERVRLAGLDRYTFAPAKGIRNLLGRVTGVHWLGMASELGLTDSVWRARYQAVSFGSDVTAVAKRRAVYPNTLSGLDAESDASMEMVTFARELWLGIQIQDSPVFAGGSDV